MELKNGYKVIYEAKDLVTEVKPGPVYASKVRQRVDGKMLISYNADTNEYVNLKQFKLIYADKNNLYGSVKNIPEGYPAHDVKIVLKDEDGVIVFGEGQVLVNNVLEAVAVAAPVAEVIEEPIEEVVEELHEEVAEEAK